MRVLHRAARPAAVLGALRADFEAASNDPEVVNDAIKRNGVPFTFVDVARVSMSCAGRRSSARSPT
jgi:hypothetical protein